LGDHGVNGLSVGYIRLNGDRILTFGDNLADYLFGSFAMLDIIYAYSPALPCELQCNRAANTAGRTGNQC
jgi:hypothetical protein